MNSYFVVSKQLVKLAKELTSINFKNETSEINEDYDYDDLDNDENLDIAQELTNIAKALLEEGDE